MCVLSKEQNSIVKCISDGKCCISDSVPGAGKTTTGIEVARNLPGKRILCLTFSSSLKAEGRGKVSRIKNIDIESYNSWILKFYGKGGVSKEEVFEVLRNNEQMFREPIDYDIIILDETQDMNILFYQMVLKFVKDSNIHPLYLVIGDKYQGVFEFLGADRRYLTLAEMIFEGNFERHYLTHSFRMTDTMSQFINQSVLGEVRIHTTKPSVEKVSYIITDPYEEKTHEYVYRQITDKIKQGAKLDDFFILFPGMRRKTPASSLNRYLTRKHLNLAYLDSETGGISEEEMRNKIVMTTFHKSKGRERKYVIVFNIDTSYFKYYKTDADPSICPPEMYVAMTRATHKMWVVQGISNTESYRQCPFFKLSLRELRNTSHCEVIPLLKNMPIKKYTRMDGPIPSSMVHEFSVSKLIQYLPDKYEEALYPLLNPLFYTVHEADGHQVAFDHTLPSKYDTSEYICDIVGIAIPSYIGHTLGIQSEIHNMIKYPCQKYKTLIKKISTPPDKIEDHLRFANIEASLDKGIEHNLRQIKHYSGIISHENVKCCELNASRIDISDEPTFEEPMIYSHYHREYGTIHIDGRVDSLSLNRLYEFKCVDHLTFEHKLQLVLYAWILQKTEPDYRRDNYLFNFFTGELLQMRYDITLIDEIMEYIFTSKYQKDIILKDPDFVRKCNSLEEARKHTCKSSYTHVSLQSWDSECCFLSSDED